MKKENQKIKKWYTIQFPTDTLAQEELKEGCTFYGLFDTMDNYQSVYNYLGQGIDSIIRERVFEKLAEIMQVDYDYVYEQWLKCHE